MIAAVVFTQGCPWRCRYCHNRSLVLPSCFRDPIPEEEVFAFLQDRRGQLDGVVISGGEPTLQDDLPEFVRRLRALGFKVKLDTNGYNPEMVAALLDEHLLDFVAMDIKAPFERYTEIAGREVSTDEPAWTIALILHSGVANEFRTTVIPGWHEVEDIYEIGNQIKGAQRYVLQEFVVGNTLDPTFNTRPTRWPRKLSAEMRSFFADKVDAFSIRSDTLFA